MSVGGVEMTRGASDRDRQFAEEREYTAQQRSALVAWHLAHGEGLRLADVQNLTALSRQGASDLMDLLCNVLPIYRDDCGVWQVCFMTEIA